LGAGITVRSAGLPRAQGGPGKLTGASSFRAGSDGAAQVGREEPRVMSSMLRLAGLGGGEVFLGLAVEWRSCPGVDEDGARAELAQDRLEFACERLAALGRARAAWPRERLAREIGENLS